VWFISFVCLIAITATAESREVWQTGKLHPKVTCSADPTKSYALYLPSTYVEGHPAPVIFVFEPAARGPLPVKLAQEAAERYGYIVIASNNSRNGAFAPQINAAQAMWKDAHDRFTIDPRRTYLAGFSGGSRFAVMFTARCNGCAAGVIASGAAFTSGLDPKSVPRFLYFGAVGREDFNFPEYLEFEPKLKAANFTYHIRRFDGAHEWAPSDVWLEAFEWFNLQAMKSGVLPRDDKFIADSYTHALANAAEQKNDMERFRGYSQASTDFSGLTDVAVAQKRAAELENSKTVKELAKRERRDADDQYRMGSLISEQLEALTDPEQRASAMLELRKLFAELRQKAKDDTDPLQMVAKRVRTQEFIHAYENGMQMIADKDYANALLLYDTIVANAIAAPGAHLQKSRIYLLLGDKSKALAEARLAVKDGVDDPENFSEPEFATLKSNPEFKGLLDSLHPTKAE
jgi:predicted esterase